MKQFKTYVTHLIPSESDDDDEDDEVEEMGSGTRRELRDPTLFMIVCEIDKKTR